MGLRTQQLATVYDVDPYRAEAFDMLLSSATQHRTDRQRAVMAFAACRNDNERRFVRRIFLLKREAWIDGMCATQRRWQSTVSKNPKKGRHHDSWAIREQYMRCQGSYHDYMAYAKEVRDNA